MRRFPLDAGGASDYANRRLGVFERARQEIAHGSRIGVAIPVLAEEVGSMRFNIPLMPIKVGVRLQMNVRWRPLPALRFSVHAMMLVVAVMAVFFSAWIWFQAHEMRLARANNHHAKQAFDPFLPGVVNRPWHAKMYNEYHAALLRNEMIAGILLTIFLMILVIAVIGRVMNWLYPRSHTTPRGKSANMAPVVRPVAPHAP